MQVVIVYNPVSGTGRSAEVARNLGRELSARGIACRLVATERAEPERWLEPALVAADAVIVAGGDGALRLVAASAARRSIPLWHAPCGTENLFARSFGMTADPGDIARALEGGQTGSVDLGDADGSAFAIMVSIGFDAAVVRALADRRTGGITRLSYAGPIIRTMRSWRATELAWTIDGEREELGRGMAVVGNLRAYGARLNPAAGASAEDGVLDAVFLPARTAIDLLPWIPQLWTGLHRRNPALRERRGSEIVLESASRAPMQYDGDAWPAGAVSRVALGVRPGALKVLRPA